MLKALRDNIFVVLDEVEKKSSIIAMLDNPDHVSGVVVHCGPGVWDMKGNFVEMIVSEGDRIIFSKNALSSPIEHDGVVYYVMQPEHIYGTIV